MKLRGLLPFIFILVLFSGELTKAQGTQSSALSVSESDLPSPRGAFLRSLALPGWGHYYANPDDWNRGKYHLAGDALLIMSYFGINARIDYLENDLSTLAQSRAGTNIAGKGREYEIAIGNYDNLSEYNTAQLQLRNWNSLFPATAEYQWDWNSDSDRFQFRDTRERIDRNNNQLPALISLMVVNRLVSGISAFIKARGQWDNIPTAHVRMIRDGANTGFQAHLSIPF